MGDGKTVWILGAGFSRSLGGPLLPQLLSFRSIGATRLRLKEHSLLSDQAARAAEAAYSQGRQPGARGDAALWKNAEEYLERLDAAAHGSTFASARLGDVFNAWTDRGLRLGDIYHAARRLVAAECLDFCIGDREPDGRRRDCEQDERWSPYNRWAKLLQPARDTVVTFNYDRVLDQLGKPSDQLEVVLPGAEHVAPPHLVQVLKLHGSVDWRRNIEKNRPRFIRADSDFALMAEGSQLAIATPGPTKLSAAGEFKTLWFAAKAALQNATNVVFIGYRFPESDAAARTELLDALAANGVPYLRVHIVLGPASPDAERLRALLRFALTTRGRKPAALAGEDNAYALLNHPLYAEDFLSVYTPQTLSWMPYNHPTA